MKADIVRRAIDNDYRYKEKMNSRLIVFSHIIFSLVFVLIRSGNIGAEENKKEVDLIFTSPRKIRMLLQTEKNVADTINEYIISERNRLQEIQEYIDIWQKEHNIRAADKFKYFENPYSKYHLTKKLTLDWQLINEKMKRNNGTAFLKKLYDQTELVWPNENDWEGVQDSILNIQLINRYKATDLSVGKIGPLTTNVQLTFDECLALMKRSENNYNYNLTLEWASASALKFFSTPNADDKHMTDVIRANLVANIIEGNITNAEHYFNIYSMLKPPGVEIENLHNLILKRAPTLSDEVLKKREKFANMTRLCSNASPISYKSNLRCRYHFKNNPFLLIAPFKEEIVSLDPRIIIIHDALSDFESQKFIEEGKKRIFETPGSEDKLDKTEFKDHLNEFEFFEEDNFQEVSRLTRRTCDMIGLYENIAQPWQVTLYGAGGFFDEHSDINQANKKEVQKYGRRLATISYSLNEVQMGGATIFPQIGLKVELHKGAALIWFNLFKDGTEDTRVQHAACPILIGYKWELIRRIHEKQTKRENY